MRTDTLALPRGQPGAYASTSRTISSTSGFSSTASTVRSRRGAAPAAPPPHRRRPAPARAGAPPDGRGARRSRPPDNAGRHRRGVIALGAPPSVKSPTCSGGPAGAIRLRPGAWRKGTRRTLDRGEPAERAVTLRDDARLGRGQGQAQALVGRGVRMQPVIGERRGQGEPRAHRQYSAPPRTSRPDASGQQDQTARSGTQRTHDPQRIGERQGVQQKHHAQRPEARADQVHAVERAGARGVHPKGQRQGQRRAEERHRQHEVESEEPAELRAVPGDLERVERERLRQVRRPGVPRPRNPGPRRRRPIENARGVCVCSTATRLPAAPKPSSATAMIM